MQLLSEPTTVGAQCAPPRPDGCLRVFVLSDVRLYSEGLAGLLAAVPSIAVVCASAVDAGTVEQILDVHPDVLLVDAVALCRGDIVVRVSTELPALRVVACGVAEEAGEIIACARSGAVGYVARDASAEELVRTVLSVQRGELHCPPRIASVLFRHMSAVAMTEVTAPATSLTAREREVIALIDRGMSNKEIAAALTIEVATVKNHVHHILEKLQVRRRSAAAARLRTPPSLVTVARP